MSALADWQPELTFDGADGNLTLFGDLINSKQVSHRATAAASALTVENVVALLEDERAKNVDIIETTRPHSLHRAIIVASSYNERHERALTLALYKRFSKANQLKVSICY